MNTDSMYYKYNPEKRNIFIEINRGRTNHAKEFVIGLLMLGASGGSAICEVFLRKKFGERYITLAQSIGIFLLLNIGYQILDNWLRFRLGASAGWFLFIFSLVFLVLAIKHRSEISRYGTTYDFKRFSLSNGEIAPFWWILIGKKIGTFKITYYLIVILLEPAIPILLGLILIIFPFSRPVGIVLFASGIYFLINNFNKAQQGRNWVLDNIDKKITNEMKYDVFIGRKPKKDTKGVYLPIELPEDEDTRKALYNIVETNADDAHDLWENDYLDSDDKGNDLSNNSEYSGKR